MIRLQAYVSYFRGLQLNDLEKLGLSSKQVKAVNAYFTGIIPSAMPMRW